MSGEKVSIGVEVTGVQKARTEMDGLVGAFAGLFNGLNQNSQASIPAFHASSNSTQVTQPNIPAGGSGTINPNLGGSSSLQSLIGVLGAPAQSFNTGRVSPGMVTSATLSQNGSNAAGTGAFGNGGGVLQVQIVSSIPLNFAGGGGGGGGFGGGGGGNAAGGCGGGGFGGQSGGGGQAYPYAAGFNAHAPGGGGFLQAFAANPSLAGLGQAALTKLPVLPLALAGIASESVNLGLESYSRLSAPGYQYDTSLAAATIQGQFVNENDRIRGAQIARNQGSQDASRGIIRDTFGKIPILGGIISNGMELGVFRDRDRIIAEEKAKLSQSDQINALAGMAGMSVGGMVGANLGVSTGLGGMAMGFGRQGVAGLVNSNSAAFTNNFFSQAQVQNSLQSIYGAAGQLGNSGMFNAIAGGGDPFGQTQNAAKVAIANGDMGALSALRPLLNNATYDSAFGALRASRTNQVAGQVAQANLGGLQSNVSLIQATGGGYRAVSGAQSVAAGGYDAERSSVAYQLSIEPNEIRRAQLQAQLQGIDAAKAGQTQQAAMTVFSGRGVETQTLSAGAGNQMYRAMYGGGGQGGVDTAFGAQGRAGMAEAQRLEDMSKSPFISTEQRALYAQQAQQKRLESGIGVDRERSSYDYGITQGKIGVRGATAQSALTQAQMFGDSGAIYGADMGMASVTGAQLSAVRGRLNDPTAHLSEPESLSLKREEISLQREYNQQLTQASRSFFSLNASIAHTSEGILSVGANVQLGMERIGGSRASGIVGGMVGAASGSLRADQASLDNLIKQGVSPNSPQYKAAQAQVAQDQAGLTGRLMSYSDLSPSLGVQSAMSRADFELNMAGKAFLPVGNRRQALDNSLNATGQAGKEMNAQYRAQVADIKKNLSGQDQKDALDAAAFNFQQKQQGLSMKAADTMQNLASNWMDQNISNVVNAPSRMSFVSSQFTQRQAAPYFQAMGDIYGGQYGFAGKGAEGSRNEVMDRFHRFGNMTIGNINTSEGFRNTALSGMTGTLHPASTEVRVILEDHRTTVVSGGKSQTVNHPGGNAGTIQAIGNGSLTQSGSTHNLSGGSHQ